MLKYVDTKKAPAAIGPYSQGIVLNGIAFFSGQIPLNPETGEVVGSTVEEQAEQVMKNIQALLDSQGASFTDVVKTTCFLADMKDFAAFNEVYAKYFTGKPARSCVAVKELPKGVLCEVETIAAVKFLAEPAAGYSPGDGLIAFRLELAVYLPHNLVGLRL